MGNKKPLDVIIPVHMDIHWPTKETLVRYILEQNRKFGFTKFALASPDGGWRSLAYPPTEFFQDRAQFFLQIKNELAPYGIVCGWWIMLTVKSGLSDDFTPMVKEDGSAHPFANCPLDPHFQSRIAQNMALFAKIAKPAFIFTEDDYSIMAASRYGCFCHYHLDEFAKRTGKRYEREELAKIMAEEGPQHDALQRQWRELMRDSLVALSRAIRQAVDEESPEIPVCYMESGAAAAEGECTVPVARAMAGDRHVPTSRIHGTFYGQPNAKKIPVVLYHPLHSRQHIQGNFHFLHETDTYPRNRFFWSGAHARAMMGAVYSYGFEGAIYHVLQRLDQADEEPAYSRVFAQERARFTEAAHIASQCQVKGVEMHNGDSPPEWMECISRFGIPCTTMDSKVAFWDESTARHADHETVMHRLSQGLFLDAPAAKVLWERGYGEYLGAEIGQDAAPGKQVYDLSEVEVICKPFAREGKGRTMTSPHLMSTNVLLALNPIDPSCEVVSETHNFQNKFLANAMTRFENKLGGRVVIMGLTVNQNTTPSLFNYRRQRLIQDLLCWCGDEYIFVKEAPDVFMIVNEAANREESGFQGMLTLINLSEDSVQQMHLHLPSKWQTVKNWKIMNQDGSWENAVFEQKGDSLILCHEFSYLNPVYMLGL